MVDVRSRFWLRTALWQVWTEYFADVAPVNDVHIAYVRPSKTRLGWIALSEEGDSTLIGINRLLSHPDVPDEVCTITIAHELVHYCHGFGSPLPRRFADPHAGDVVDRELRLRGLGEALQRSQRWAQSSWPQLYAEHAAARPRFRRHRPDGDANRPLTSPQMAALDV